MKDLAFLGDDFDPNSIMIDFGNITPGWYQVLIADAAVKDTKALTGKYLEVNFQVLGPAFAGRRVWERYNILNQNEKAQTIGRARFAKLCQTVNLNRVQDSSVLVDKTLWVKVIIKNDRAEVQDCARQPPKGEATTAANAFKAKVAPTPPPQATGLPPWQQQQPAANDESDDLPF